MQLKKLDQQLSIGPQVTPDEIADLAKWGFRSIISNRPDDEDTGQPSFVEMAAAAQAQGMEARHIPVAPGRVTSSQAEEFRTALEELPSPTFAFCRSGGRALTLAKMIGRSV